MRKIFSMLLLLIASIAFTANINVGTGSNGYSITKNNSVSLELQINTADLVSNVLNNEKGLFTDLNFNSGIQSGEIGAPALPAFSKLIETPAGAECEVTVVSTSVKEYSLDELGIEGQLSPMQPSYSKSTKPEDIKFVYDTNAYLVDKWYGSETADVVKNGTMRGVGVATLSVTPVQYNPVQRKIRVLSDIKVEVKFIGGNTSAKEIEYSPFFADSYKKMINYTEPSSKDDLTVYPVTYLMVISDALQGNAKLQEFIDWKVQKGFNVVTHYVSASDTYTTIDTWVEDQYNNLDPKPSFLLIVGDMNGTYTVQTRTSGLTSGVSASDLPYGVMGATSVSNHLPSLYVGRFSVRSEEELAAQVDKTLWYERDMYTAGADLSYLENAMGVAGADSGHQATYGNPHILYAMAYYFNDTYLHPLTSIPMMINGIPYLDGGSGQASNIVNHVSEGVAYYNYTAHGSNTSFGDPSFTISNINSLNNAGKYGLIIGNCCLTGSFGDAECFGEAWLNVPDKGSVGFIGASASTYWDEDLAMGVGLPAVGNTTPAYTPEDQGMVDGLMLMDYPTQAGVKHVGLLAVDAMSSSRIMYYWECYHLFGDPSLMTTIGVPSTMEDFVSHLPTVVPGSDSFEVTALPGSYVALSDEDGILHGAGICDDTGNITLQIEPFIPGDAKLVITTPFMQPWVEMIPIVPLNSPYPVKDNVVVNVTTYGSSSTINLALKNVGIQSSDETIAIISEESEFISITDDNADYGSIAPGETKNIDDAFAFDIINGTPDQTEITFDLTVTNNYGTKQQYDYNFKFKVDAPVMNIGNLVIDDSTGDNDGMIDPGETVTAYIPVENIGHAVSASGAMNINITNAYVTVGNSSYNFSAVHPEQSEDCAFTLTASPDAPIGTPLSIVVNVGAGQYSASETLGTTIGVTMEGFESGTLTNLPWEFNDVPWTIDNSVYHSGLYSAKSGVITHNGVTEMSVALSFGSEGYVKFFRKVSSESNYDYLRFYIDETEIEKWSGDVDWSELEYTVPAGDHILRWVYSKDGSASTGLDCAWIDDIETTGAVVGYFMPPQNLIATVTDHDVNLVWESPKRLIASIGKEEPSNGKTKPEPRKIVFVPASASKDLTGYNVYRNDDYIANVGAGTVTYNDLSLADGVYKFNVTALYSDPGESAYSNDAMAHIGVGIVSVFSDDFEGTKAWTLTGEFEIGAPQGLGGEHGNPDPTSAYEGNGVLGTDLTGLATFPGDYENNLEDRAYTAVSPVIDCSGVSEVKLKFAKMLNVESPTYDHAYIDVYDGSEWNEIWTNNAAVSDTDWSMAEFDISEYADDNPLVQIRFAIGGSDGSFQYSGWNIDNLVVEGLGVISIDDNVPENFTVYQNYPNPFNPETNISFFNNKLQNVNISIYNIAGEKVAVIADKDFTSGIQTVRFSAEKFNSGVYYYRVKTSEKLITRKMVLVK